MSFVWKQSRMRKKLARIRVEIVWEIWEDMGGDEGDM